MLPNQRINCSNDASIKGSNDQVPRTSEKGNNEVAILAPMVTLEPVATPEDIILIQKEARRWAGYFEKMRCS